jgi:hypothetical protein
MENKRDPVNIYEYFMNNEICEHIAQQTNLHVQQKIKGKQ